MTNIFPFAAAKLTRSIVSLSPKGRKKIINSALDEFAIRLSVLECAGKQNNRSAVRKAVYALMSIGHQNGLGGLTNAAHNVRALTAAFDDPALAAAVARLVRLGDMCLVSLWAIQDQKNRQL